MLKQGQGHISSFNKIRNKNGISKKKDLSRKVANGWKVVMQELFLLKDVSDFS